MEFDTLARAWRRRAARESAERLERADRVREAARQAAAILQNEFGVAGVSVICR